MFVAFGLVPFASLPGKIGGVLIGGGKHLSVAGFYGRKVSRKPFVIFGVSPPRDRRKYVIYGEKQALLGKIGDEADQVVSPAVDFNVLAFGEVINADMSFGAARHAAGN